MQEKDNVQNNECGTRSEDENVESKIDDDVVGFLECEDEDDVSTFVKSLVKKYNGNLTVFLTEVYQELIEHRAAELRGVLLIVLLFHELFEELLEHLRFKKEAREAFQDSILSFLQWLNARELDAILRLSLPIPLTNISSTFSSSKKTLGEIFQRNKIELFERQYLAEELVSTRLFRIVLSSKYNKGPAQIFWLELFVFIILFFCHSFSHMMQRRALSKQPVYVTWLILALATPCICYTTIRIQFQIHFLASMERRVRTNTADNQNKKHILYKICIYPVLGMIEIICWLLNRIAIIAAQVIFLPMIIIMYIWKPKTCTHIAQCTRHFFFSLPNFHFTDGISIPKSWLNNPLNWIEAIFILLIWAWFFLTLRYTFFRHFRNTEPAFSWRVFDILNMGTLFGYLRILDFLTSSPKYSTFVIFLTKRLFLDLKAFFVVVFILYAAFTHVLYNSVLLDKAHYRAKHSERQKKMVPPLGDLMLISYFYFTTGSTSDIASQDFRYLDNILIAVATFIMLIVLFNVLVALIIESYDKVARRADTIFWYHRFEIIVKIHAIWGDLLQSFLEEREDQERLRKKEHFLTPSIKKELHHVHEFSSRSSFATGSFFTKETEKSFIEVSLQENLIEAYHNRVLNVR